MRWGCRGRRQVGKKKKKKRYNNVNVWQNIKFRRRSNKTVDLQTRIEKDWRRLGSHLGPPGSLSARGSRSRCAADQLQGPGASGWGILLVTTLWGLPLALWYQYSGPLNLALQAQPTPQVAWICSETCNIETTSSAEDDCCGTVAFFIRFTRFTRFANDPNLESLSLLNFVSPSHEKTTQKSVFPRRDIEWKKKKTFLEPAKQPLRR